MTTMTIRNIDDALESRLRVQAARHGRSMEEEARRILRVALNTDPVSGLSLIEEIRALVEPFGGVDLETPSRAFVREPSSPDKGEQLVLTELQAEAAGGPV